MVNKCAAPKCQRGYTSSTQENCWTKNGFVLSIGVIGSYKTLSFMRVAFGRYLQN